MANRPPTPPRRVPWLTRLLLAGFGLAVGLLGLWAVLTGQYDGATSLHGGAVVHLTDEPARRMGWILIMLGLLPQLVWCPHPRWVVRLGVGWAMLFGWCLYQLIYA